GYIPSRRIEPGDKTDEPIRNRGWTHWHHLFNPRQLLVNGLLMAELNYSTSIEFVGFLLGVLKTADWNNRLCIWDSSHGREEGKNLYLNQAINTLSNYSCRPFGRVKTYFTFGRLQDSLLQTKISTVETKNITYQNTMNDLWIT